MKIPTNTITYSPVQCCRMANPHLEEPFYGRHVIQRSFFPTPPIVPHHATIQHDIEYAMRSAHKPQIISIWNTRWALWFRKISLGTAWQQSGNPWKTTAIEILVTTWKSGLVHWPSTWTLPVLQGVYLRNTWWAHIWYSGVFPLFLKHLLNHPPIGPSESSKNWPQP